MTPLEIALHVAAAVVIGLGLLVEVDLPKGGRIALGVALLLAALDLAHPVGAVGVVVAALAVTKARRSWTEVGLTALPASVALVVHHGAALLTSSFDDSDLAGVLRTAAAGAAFFAVDLVLRRNDRARLDLLDAAGMHLALLCSASLVVLGWRRDLGWALVAAVPLVVTHLSFRRYAEARETYAQTIKALSLVPEVAGHTELGHGVRTAVYATALAESMNLEPDRVARIDTAARLHHIGYISLHEPSQRASAPDPDELGRVGAEILRETGMLGGVARLVETVVAEPHLPTDDLDAAIVRVASTLDDLAGMTGRSPLGDPFVALLARHPSGSERTAAIALTQLYDRCPELLEEARAATRPLAEVAASSHSH